MKPYILSTTFIVLLFLCVPTDSNAYHDEEVHPAINERAVSTQSLQLDAFLRDYLGFRKGLDEIMTGQYYVYKTKREEEKLKSIADWFKDGGTAEDETPRFLNHFHDPLVPWDSSYLSACDGSLASRFIELESWVCSSTVFWAQNFDENLYSWDRTRGNYYYALVTGSQDAFAATFRGLGQLTHLVSDMSVPSHVRDDIHPGKGLQILSSKLKSDFYEEFTKTRDFLDNHLKTMDGINVSPAMIGLGEYTNANFLSQDTMFVGYDYPQYNPEGLAETIDWLHPTNELAEDGVYDNRYYITAVS